MQRISCLFCLFCKVCTKTGRLCKKRAVLPRFCYNRDNTKADACIMCTRRKNANGEATESPQGASRAAWDRAGTVRDFVGRGTGRHLCPVHDGYHHRQLYRCTQRPLFQNRNRRHQAEGRGPRRRGRGRGYHSGTEQRQHPAPERRHQKGQCVRLGIHRMAGRRLRLRRCERRQHGSAGRPDRLRY